MTCGVARRWLVARNVRFSQPDVFELIREGVIGILVTLQNRGFQVGRKPTVVSGLVGQVANPLYGDSFDSSSPQSRPIQTFRRCVKRKSVHVRVNRVGLRIRGWEVDNL